jgi:hypothetical protein
MWCVVQQNQRKFYYILKKRSFFGVDICAVLKGLDQAESSDIHGFVQLLLLLREAATLDPTT